jgi:cyclopropane fatty-acyl-phospholipid synthase-like methyltransferase
LFTEIKADAITVAAAELGPPVGLDTLDVGCGAGRTDRLLAGRFRSVTGVDVAAGVVERAEPRRSARSLL